MGGVLQSHQKSLFTLNRVCWKKFSLGFLEQVKKLGEKGKTNFIKVPPVMDKLHKSMPTTLEDAPIMKFRQKEGERTCLTYSFASALDHAGARQNASEVCLMSKKIMEKHNTISYFIDMLKKHTKPLNFKILKVNDWNIIKNEENNLIVVLLRGSDGKEDHCVTILGKWIFDSNLKNAIPLTKESLDLCCSSDDSNDHFVKVVQALLCTNYMNMMDKKAQKKRKK